MHKTSKCEVKAGSEGHLLPQCTWDVGELHLFGHGSDLVLQVLVAETHHLALERGRQQLLLPGLTQPVHVALRREAAEAVLHEGVRVPEPSHHKLEPDPLLVCEAALLS